jgi:ferritin-like metal-binding protein YciE
VYYAEKRILSALPKMIDKASESELKQGFETHFRETEHQVDRLDDVFQKLGVESKSVSCPAIDGIIEEAEDIAGDVSDKNVLDAALIAAAQAVEHYEIARYGTLIAWAKQLGYNDSANILAETLAEEKQTNQKLTNLAEKRINLQAAE